jgi:hypothetical protein
LLSFQSTAFTLRDFHSPLGTLIFLLTFYRCRLIVSAAVFLKGLCMKKYILVKGTMGVGLLFIIGVLIFLLSACGRNEEAEAPPLDNISTESLYLLEPAEGYETTEGNEATEATDTTAAAPDSDTPQIYPPGEPLEPEPFSGWICEELAFLYLEGLPISQGFEFQYEYGRVRRVEGSPRSPFNITLIVNGNYADYYFGYQSTTDPVLLDKSTVNHYVSVGEESIRFVADWLGVEPGRRFRVYFIHVDDMGGGGGYGNGMLTSFQDIADPPWAMAHEAVHALLRAANIPTNFPTFSMHWPELGPNAFVTIPFFEEGMCIMLELLFEIATENERFAREAAGWRRGYRQTPGYHGNQETRLDLEEALKYINNRAIENLTYYYDPENTDLFGTRYTMLNMYHTPASFMFYIYTERGSREDLLRFYQNINLAEEIYGTDMDGLIADWYAWLDGWR